MLTFILGGARSGKSDLATKVAAASGRDVTFVATMRQLDDEMRDRVAAHRNARPSGWTTVEAPLNLVDTLRTQTPAGRFILIDCVTVWISNLLMEAMPEAEDAPRDTIAGVTSDILRHVEDVAAWASAYDGDVAVVSNDVGSGVVPPYALGRIFRDIAGSANKTFAASAGRTYFVIAGMALDLRALGARSIDDIAQATGNTE